MNRPPLFRVFVDMPYAVRVVPTDNASVRHVRPDTAPFWADWTVVRVIDRAEPVSYEIADAPHSMASTTNFDHAQVVVRGRTKFDGCTEWELGERFHMCFRTEFEEFGRLLTQVYDLAFDAMGREKP